MDNKDIHDFLALHVPRFRSVYPLAGDASLRKYYRVSADDVTYVLCHDENFTSDNHNAYPYLQVYELLRNSGVPVAEVFSTDPQKGFLLMEDLGDELLEYAVPRYDAVQKQKVYKTILDSLIKIQGIHGSGTAFDLYFDTDKLMFEFNFFIDHALQGYFGAKLSGNEKNELQNHFMSVAKILYRPELAVFTHRDFHSRNIMLKESDFYIIDFQDARMGLPQYDLASLLRDSYTVLSPSDLEELKSYYYTTAREAGIHTMDRDLFEYFFDIQAFQRNIKALGTFGYQCTVIGNMKFKQYFDATLGYLKDYITARPELRGAAEILQKHIAL